MKAWFKLFTFACFISAFVFGCAMGDEGNPTSTVEATGGSSGTTECTPGTTGIACDCDATHVQGTKSCSSTGYWNSCTGCTNTDADGDGYKNDKYGGNDCVDTNATIHPGATDICGDGIDQDCSGSDAICTGVCSNNATQGCNCSSTMINGTQTCVSGQWNTCSGCSTVGVCSANQTQSCNCSSTMINGTQSCTNGQWGTCYSCTQAPTCNGTETRSCNTCTGGGTNGTQTCSNGQWGSCTGCSSGVPTACANQAGVTAWTDVTLVITTNESTVVQFQDVCGVYDSSQQKWTASSDWTVVPGCESVSGSGTFTCHTRRPTAWNGIEANGYLNNGFWAVGVLTNADAQAACPSNYNSTTRTCQSVLSVEVFNHATMSIDGITCNSGNAVANGNNDGINCRVIK